MSSNSFSFTSVLAAAALIAAVCYIFFALLNRKGKYAALTIFVLEYVLVFLADLSHVTPDHLYQICSINSCEFVPFSELFVSTLQTLLMLNASTFFIPTFIITYIVYRILGWYRNKVVPPAQSSNAPVPASTEQH